MMTIRWLREQMRQGKSIFDLPLRVTFYARVSTEKVEQQGSLENQIQYYTEFIQKNPNWTYIPGYIDEGISGTSTYKRDSFLRMIADAQRGMFDFIITKEISRFSRNTLDSIQYTQELLENNVGVLFQNDNINTLDSDSEFRLVVMAGVAQDEVRKLSERLKFGFRQSIKNGHVLGNNRLWGYDWHKDYDGSPMEEYFLSVAREDFRLRRCVNFAVRLGEDFIGEAVLYNPDWQGGMELGCRIAPAYAGRGYGTEAFAAAADWALYGLGLARVVAKCFKENGPSYKMLSSCMRETGQDETYFYFEKTI